MTDNEKLTEQLKYEDIGRILPKARKKGHVCPICDNGSGTDGDGIRKQPRSKPPLYKCFKCGFSGSLILTIIIFIFLIITIIIIGASRVRLCTFVHVRVTAALTLASL